MTECPELGALEANPLPPELRDHISGCNSCKLVLEVVGDVRLELDDCIRFDALLAARADGTLGRAGKNLLERHLASCASCREVAETLSPTQDADGDQENLPQVDPASYALGLEVARGGMGRVIAARDLRIGRPIAIKELLGRSPQLAARFEREARVTARLQHPGIVPIYEIGKWPDGTPFYSMRMVDGRMLAEAIESAKTLPARLALLPAVIAATEAVAFAHAKRVIHRDLTPSNILVGAYGETVVIDWGLAKDLADGSAEDELDEVPESSSERLTGVGAVIGTATYMPPEQAHAIPVDERADVYALGAILYHVLAGVPPYRAKTSKELLRAVKTAPPPPIDRVQPGTPRDLVSIITKAMARDPDARYPSARELAEELKRFQTGRLVEAHVYSRFELFKRFLARHRAVVTVSLLALAISLSFGTIAVRKILRSNHEARETVRELILEKGRIELLAGNTQRALAYLWHVYQTGDDSPTLQFLLGSALRGLSTSEHTLDCGTNGSARSLAFDRSATFVAAGCHEVTKVWRIADGKEVASFETGDTGYDGVKFSPDATLLATWGESGIARVWDLATGALVAKLDHNSEDKQRAAGVANLTRSEINRAAFSPDAARLATTGADGFAIIWDVRKQAVLHRLEGSVKPGGLGSLYGGMSPDGKRLYTVSPDGIGKGWDAITGAYLGEVDHGDLTIGGDLSPTGDYAVSCGQDGRVRIWDAVGNRGLIDQFEGHTAPVWKCVFSDNGKLVVSGGHDGRANVYDVEAAKLLTTVDHGDIVINADVSPDKQRFATTGLAGRVRLWDTRTGALIANLDTVKGKDARFADNEHLVAARGDGRIQIFRLEPPAHLDSVPGDAEIGAASMHVVYTDDTLAKNVVVRELGRRTNATTGLTAPFAVAKDAPYVAGLVTQRHVRVIDVSNKGAPRDIQVEHAIARLALSADGARLAVMFAQGEPQVWDVASGARLVTLAGAREATLSENGRIALGWQQTELRVWDVDAHTAGVTIPAAAAFSVVGFANMGTRLAIREGAGVVANVKLWNTQTGKLIAERSDTGTVTTFDTSRRWLTTIDADHSVTVWSTDDGSVRTSFLGEKLMQVQTNAKATFVAGIAEYGAVALLMSAADGRILARWPLEHSAPVISSTGFDPPKDGSVMWTHDGSAVMTRSAKVAVWPVANGYGAKQMAQLVNRNVSWRVENGQLAWIRNAKLHGTVMRAGTPQPNVEVVVEIRTPADIGAAPISWESSKKRVSTRKLKTNALGEFSTENLLPGEYTLTVEKQTITAYVSAEDEPIQIELASP